MAPVIAHRQNRMTSILSHVTEAFPPARQGTTINNHRVIGAANTSIVLNCVLVTYIIMTAIAGLPDAVKRHTPGQIIYCI